MVDLVEFRRRLTETVVWCGATGSGESWLATLNAWREDWNPVGVSASATPPAGVLRTPGLRPPVLHEVSPPTTPPERVVMERRAIVAELASKRARQLRTRGRDSQSLRDDLAGGRLLLYAPDDTDISGGSTVDSDGFFDWDDCPPWDTWVSYEDGSADPGRYWRSFLVAWVPPALLGVADAGIRASPMACIEWADRLDTDVTRRLRAVGFLKNG